MDGRFIRAEAGKYPLCEVPGFGVMQSGVDKANATLMAASPDMLAELKWLVRCMDGVVTGDYEPDEEATDVATSIIAKAEGRNA